MENHTPNNARIHRQSLSFSKLADGLLDPKLVLAWLVTSVGGGAFLVGLLVPIREAGALLPQLFTAPRVRRVVVRKWWWVAGSVVQGVCAIGIAAAAFWLEGFLAGVIMVSFLAVLSLARSISSVSYKDVLGKTVEKKCRGKVNGTAASIASVGVFIFGLLLMYELYERFWLVLTAIVLAGLCWGLAALRFSQLEEAPSDVQKEQSERLLGIYWNYLRQDAELRRFIIVRALLVSTAVAPPFLVLLATGQTSAALPLGSLVIAASFATAVSGSLWGSLADASTKITLAVSGATAGLALCAAVVLSQLGYFTNIFALSAILFALMTSYQGVRVARTVHLTNLAGEDTRAGYTAISNTLIGLVLLGSGALGALALLIGVINVVLVLGLLSFLGAGLALRLQAV